MKELFLLRGLPGAGKSTLAESLECYRLEADTYHMNEKGEYNWKPENVKDAHEWCRIRCEEFMQMELKIAVANTFTQEWEMQPYYDLAEEHGYRVYSLIVENRHDGKNQHGVPVEKLVQMKNRFEISL